MYRQKKGGGSARFHHSARCASKWRRLSYIAKFVFFSNVAPKILENVENAHTKKSDTKSPGLPWRCGGRLGVQMSAQGEYEPQTGQKTSTASKTTLGICLMRTKVVASSPICKSSVVDLVMSRDHQNDNAFWLCRFRHKKVKQKMARSRAHLNRRPLAPESAVYQLGYLGIDECMWKN